MSAEYQAKVDEAVRSGDLTEASGKNIARWLSESYLEPYRDKLTSLIDAGDWKRLDILFYETIPFGTGGRRGLMSDIGSATINDRTIAESADGLAAYLKTQKPEGPRSAVVACDTRNRSFEFAQLTATTFAAHGMKVFFFESHRSTPELSFAVRHLGCDVGVMVSASHNPPSDNGFKAYWTSGGQVLPPHDKGIIDHVYRAEDIPTRNFDQAVAEQAIEVVGPQIDSAYLDAAAELSLSEARDVSILFSPLHGVGESNVAGVLKRTGFRQLEIFEPQREPHGDFPNVADHFPNPERTVVFDPAIERAKESGADVIMASDPDADRLGIVVPEDSGAVHLTGNRVGALIVDYVLGKRTEKGDLTPEHYVVETMVTTPLIGAIAKSYNVGLIDDLLVGFKYIGQAMDQNGPDKFVFGAEESLGYLAGEYARDKDAAVAGLYVAELGAELKEKGKTLLDRLDELFIAHGYHNEGQRSEVCPGPAGREQIKGLIKALRAKPPEELAGVTLASVRDYGTHEVRSLPGNAKSGDLPEPQGELLFFESAPGEIEVKIAARPSGTEPKIKFYFFVKADVPDGNSLAAVQAAADAKMTEVQDALSAWVKSTVGQMES
ncbi:phospho-sugar mutase [Stratiformator vulcanicus]|uniref:Phosphoglucomutase n=1 Tax=Stratiformator vulcanicus TaxID=2527980 RepID=A0A517R6D0_9PLAN|nr:phospho-sugar mutase [Stratiformator vulcanicus]QDT39446.1 Phosphoglucomutase [Stratiformator vulcanicus]